MFWDIPHAPLCTWRPLWRTAYVDTETYVRDGTSFNALVIYNENTTRTKAGRINSGCTNLWHLSIGIYFLLTLNEQNISSRTLNHKYVTVRELLHRFYIPLRYDAP